MISYMQAILKHLIQLLLVLVTVPMRQIQLLSLFY